MSVTVDAKRLKTAFVQLFAGLGIVTIWLLLLSASLAAAFYGFAWVSALEWFGVKWFEYVVGVLFIPILIFCWWLCFFLSLEFLSEIGIEINGIARILVVPIAPPLAVVGFLVAGLISSGQSIKNRVVFVLSLIVGAAVVVATLV